MSITSILGVNSISISSTTLTFSVFLIIVLLVGLFCTRWYLDNRKNSSKQNTPITYLSGVYVKIAGSGNTGISPSVRSENILTADGEICRAYSPHETNWKHDDGYVGFIRDGDIVPVDVIDVRRREILKNMEIPEEYINIISSAEPNKDIREYVHATTEENDDEKIEEEIQQLTEKVFSVQKQLENIPVTDGYVGIHSYRNNTSVSRESVRIMIDEINRLFLNNRELFKFCIQAGLLIIGGTVVSIAFLYYIMHGGT